MTKLTPMNFKKYVVDHIARHIGKGAKVIYVVWWFCSPCADDTVGTDTTPKQFINSSWRRMQGKNAWQ